jgi:hypothetical protein
MKIAPTVPGNLAVLVGEFGTAVKIVVVVFQW